MAFECNVNPCDIGSIIAGQAGNCSGLMDPQNINGDQMIYDLAFQDLINLYGITINYYVNGFNLSAANTLYGEHTTQNFYGPFEIKSYVELIEGSLALSRFGFDSADDLTAYLHIGTFNTVFAPLSVHIPNGQYIEPKSGDLIELIALGCNRPNNRGAKIFEVTERMDQDVSSLNPLLGHYVYRLRAKRYVHTYETNAPQESRNEQMAENTAFGKLSSALYPSLTSEGKTYPGDIDTTSSQGVYDMGVNNTSIYGGYY